MTQKHPRGDRRAREWRPRTAGRARAGERRRWSLRPAPPGPQRRSQQLLSPPLRCSRRGNRQIAPHTASAGGRPRQKGPPMKRKGQGLAWTKRGRAVSATVQSLCQMMRQVPRGERRRSPRAARRAKATLGQPRSPARAQRGPRAARSPGQQSHPARPRSCPPPPASSPLRARGAGQPQWAWAWASAASHGRHR